MATTFTAYFTDRDVTDLKPLTDQPTTIGFIAGDGGAVTQATDRTTTVVLNKQSGAITTQATSLAAGAEVEFTVTNSTVAINDVVVLSVRSGQTATTSFAYVSAVAAGSFKITLSNLAAATADTGAMIINFVVLKGAVT